MRIDEQGEDGLEPQSTDPGRAAKSLDTEQGSAPRESLQGVSRDQVSWDLLKAAIDSVNTLIVVADARREDQPLVFINRHFEAFTGYSAEEVLGRNCRFLQRRPDGTMDRDQPGLDKVRQSAAEGTYGRALLRNYKKSGERFWNDLYMSPVHGEDGELLYIVGVQNDVTQRVEAQSQRQEMADTLTSFYNAAPMLMGVVEREGAGENRSGVTYRHLHANRTAATFFGISPEAMVGMTYAELGFTPECASEWARGYAEAEREGRPIRFECTVSLPGVAERAAAVLPRSIGEGSWQSRGRLLLPDGEDEEIRHLNVTVNLIARRPGGAVQFSYIAEDVTERKRAERERRLLVAAVEQADESLIVTERELEEPGPRFVYTNPAFTRLTGWRPEEIVGKTPRILQGAETNRSELDRLRRDLSEKHSFRGETINYRKDGSPFNNEWHISALYDEEGNVTHWVSTQRDVTERRRAESEVRRLNQELEERVRARTAELEARNGELQRAKEEADRANHAKSAFLANMSHEIRTPLTAILGFAGLLAARVPSEHRPVLGRIENAGRRLMDTLNSVLELARLDAGRHRIHLEELNVAAEAQDVTELFRARAESKNLELTFAASTEARDARALLDRGALSSILNNLIGNAIKFTEEGRIAVRVRAGDGRIAIEVRDTGIGIGEEFQPQLFGAFVQESSGQARSHEGSGLGLSIVKRLAELMHGTVSVTSAQGAGSAFVVSFPLADGAGAYESPSASLRQADATAPSPMENGRPRVLAVEDNEDTQFLLESLLSGDYALTVASNVAEGKAAVQDAPTVFDFVLLDINLGGTDSGTDLLRWLRGQPGYERVPVVALTAYALPGDADQFRKAGFDAYLAKPFQPDQLLALAARLADGRRK